MGSVIIAISCVSTVVNIIATVIFWRRKKQYDTFVKAINMLEVEYVRNVKIFHRSVNRKEKLFYAGRIGMMQEMRDVVNMKDNQMP